MKRICPCCNKIFVYSKKIRKAEIAENFLPEGTETYCYSCIKDISSIEREHEQAFWEQSLPLSDGCGGDL